MFYADADDIHFQALVYKLSKLEKKQKKNLNISPLTGKILVAFVFYIKIHFQSSDIR